MPAIKSIVTWVQGFVDKLNSLDDGTKKVIVTIALVVAAIGPVLIVVGKVISAVGTIMTIVPKLAGVINVVKGAFAALNTTMLANPIVLIIAAIAAGHYSVECNQSFLFPGMGGNQDDFLYRI